MIYMKTTIYFAICLLAILFETGCSKKQNQKRPLAEEKKLIVYTSHKPEIFEPIIKEFEERSGIWVKVVEGGTNELLNQIAKNGEYGCADVIFGGGVDNLASYSRYFEPYRTNQFDKLDQTYASTNDSYTVFSKLPIVFIYNENLVISAGTPRSFKELLSIKWKGRIAFASPVYSGSAYTALATMIQVLDYELSKEEITRQFIKNLDGDICEDSKDVIEQVISGDKAIGITLEETALKRIKRGAKIGIVYPREGTSSVPDGSAILKNAPHLENARLFIDFVTSSDVQYFLEDKLSRRSVRTDISGLDSIPEMNYDINFALEKREDLMQLWNTYTGAN